MCGGGLREVWWTKLSVVLRQVVVEWPRGRYNTLVVATPSSTWLGWRFSFTSAVGRFGVGNGVIGMCVDRIGVSKRSGDRVGVVGKSSAGVGAVSRSRTGVETNCKFLVVCSFRGGYELSKTWFE